ncbi:MAG TPA: hypothetical protein VER39_02975 [Nocardioidaceae bacterium]|nr:hypothetical protein [Nocardioidaceae bacterium]
MSETTPENAGTERPGQPTAPEEGLIPDEQLPDDLQPDKNPLAAQPDDGPDGEASGPPPGLDTPDVGQPG